MTTPLRRAALLLWGLVVVLVALTWTAAAVRASRTQFETGARILHRVLSQRSEQQEAVLASMTALTQAGVTGAALGQYAAAMRAQYPQIAGIQRCQPGCQSVGPQGMTLPTEPLQPDDSGLRWHPVFPAVYALAQGDVRVWVDVRRLFREDDFTDLASGFRLHRPGNGPVLVEQAVRTRKVSRLLPVLSVQKVLGSADQPLTFEGEHPLGWAELPLAGVALFALCSALAAAGVVRLTEGRERAHAAAQHAEQALHTERARAERAFHAVSEALIVTDELHRVRLANPAARALLGDPLTAGRDLREVVHFRATLNQVPFNPNEFWNQPGLVTLPEGVSLVAGGAARLVEGALAPVQDRNQPPAGWVLVLRDVGPLRSRVVAALEEGERRVREHAETLAHVTRLSTLGEMGAGLAHELNQPLTAIVSHGQAALRLLDDSDRDDPQWDGARVRRSVEATVTQAKRAASIIAHLRTLVRRAPSEVRPVDVHQVLENVEMLIAHEAERLGVRLVVQPGTAPLMVRGDPVHLEQVLLNVVRNAVEATRDRPGAEVRLLACHQGRNALVEVQDTGPGLTAAVQERLFTPFTTTKPAGLGLGLSLSYTLMQGMGGDLRGHNGPAGGAVFTVTLPLAVEAPYA
ncbi:sensor histidine kinase [Deinococcus sp. QL22]|uniref:sensor histidine kinase n=1 Tax=Deinococcus sp. QL22 TaxID=2939437 RepID=UPI002017D2A2|nr:ATP-binding protein [Deinococcus sp. QL22]UQN08366.1 ATP-binding protein [Deinococcus sp. QL22]